MKINRNSKCPCGSDKKYKVCCLPKESETKTIPIDDKIREILNRENDQFKNLLGRDIGNDDPLIPSAINVSEEDYIESAATVLEMAGIRPEIIYAFKKTGVPIAEEKLHLYSKRQLKLWNDAIQEYFDIKSGKVKPKTNPVEVILFELQEILNKVEFLYAIIIRKYSRDAKKIILTDKINPNDYIVFCLTKNLKSLKAISALLSNNFGEDALNLVRTNFENYLEINYAIRNSNSLKEFLHCKEGVLLGSHCFEKGNYIELSSKKKFKPLTNFEKSKLNPEYGQEDVDLYKYLYDYLSSHTHLDIRTVHNYVDIERGFDFLSRNLGPDALITLLVINTMILDQLRSQTFLEKSRVDIETILNQLMKSLFDLFNSNVGIDHSIIKRIQKINIS